MVLPQEKTWTLESPFYSYYDFYSLHQFFLFWRDSRFYGCGLNFCLWVVPLLLLPSLNSFDFASQGGIFLMPLGYFRVGQVSLFPKIAHSPLQSACNIFSLEITRSKNFKGFLDEGPFSVTSYWQRAQRHWLCKGVKYLANLAWHAQEMVYCFPELSVCKTN